ncbi:BolA protein [Strigomonas culicis]|uniref:BolA protein n=1 Tax=Strigomonas culicis TaxID=28005 RepID=S9W9F1_9TRYP|nr:BolA protein [Strigomonas culicis]|eukprot:EPY35916.1 BolA protein [Strigomonas culicis]
MEGTIRERLTNTFAPIELNVVTVDAQSGSYDVKVVSKTFDNVPLRERHQMINKLFEEELLSGTIHSLTISAKPANK